MPDRSVNLPPSFVAALLLLALREDRMGRTTGKKAGRIKELKRGIGSVLAVRVVEEYDESK